MSLMTPLDVLLWSLVGATIGTVLGNLAFMVPWVRAQLSRLLSRRQLKMKASVLLNLNVDHKVLDALHRMDVEQFMRLVTPPPPELHLSEEEVKHMLLTIMHNLRTQHSAFSDDERRVSEIWLGQHPELGGSPTTIN